MIAGIPDDIQLYEEEFFEFQSDPGAFQLLGVLRVVDGTQGFVALHEVEWCGDKVGDCLRQGWQFLQQGTCQFLEGA